MSVTNGGHLINIDHKGIMSSMTENGPEPEENRLGVGDTRKAVGEG